MAKSATIVLLILLLAAYVQARPLHNYGKSTHARWPWNILNRDYQDTPVHTPGLSVAGIDYYVQFERGGSALQELIPAVNTTTLNNFGLTQVFALNVTAGADPTSTQLGYVRGFTVQASYTSAGAAVEVEIVEYNDGTLNGTVSIQGLVLNGATEVAVVGGTGDFRGVRGYGIITFVNATDTTFLFHHALYFL